MRYETLSSLMNRVSDEYRMSLKTLIEVYREYGDLDEVGASCYMHASKPKGLIEHSIRVTENLLKLKEVLAPEISDSDCVLAGLLHDISKAGIPLHDDKENFQVIPRYVKNEYFDDSRAISSNNRPFNYAQGQIEFQLAVSTALVVVHFIPNIPITVLQAIAASDGPTVSRQYYHRECKLALLLEYADRWALAEETKELRPQFDGIKFGKARMSDGTTVTSAQGSERLEVR